MKKLVKLAVASAVVFGASSAMAEEVAVEEVKIEAGSCILFDGTGTLTTSTGDILRQGRYPDGYDNIVVYCLSKDVTPTVKKAEKHSIKDGDAIGCNVPGYGLTRDWKNVVTPSGNSILTCVFPDPSA